MVGDGGVPEILGHESVAVPFRHTSGTAFGEKQWHVVASSLSHKHKDTVKHGDKPLLPSTEPAQ